MSEWPPSQAARSGIDPLTGVADPEPAPSSAAPAVAAGRPLAEAARWEQRGDIGVGGMGTVALVHDRWLRRELAVKRPVSPADHERLLREALVTARLEHPGIVAVYDAGADAGGAPWFAMRLVRGRSLAEIITRTPDREARLRLLRHVLAAAEAVAYAHAQGVVHRDLKPANVMVGAFGETQVIDWGLALTPDLPTPDPGRAGTPSAMSPEQARGEPLDARADVYALGAILRELVSGRPLFTDSDRDHTLAALAAERIPPLRDGDPELVAIITRAMAPRAADRYADAKALADDVGRYLEGHRVHAHSYSPLELLRRLVRAWRVPLLVAALALVGLAAVIVVDRSHLAAERDRTAAQLARTLVDEARHALAADARGPAEIMARAAFLHLPDEARGVLVSLPAERPTQARLAPLECDAADVATDRAGRARVLCRSPAGLAVVEASGTGTATQRWGVSGDFEAAAFLDRGRVALALKSDLTLEYYDAAGGDLLRSEPERCLRHRLEPGADGVSAVGSSGNCAVRVRLDGLEMIPVEGCRDGRIRAAALAPDGERWAVACDDGAVVVGNFTAGDPVGPAALGRRYEVGLPVPPAKRLATALAFADDGRLLVGNDAGELLRVRLGDGPPAPHELLALGRGVVREIVVAPDLAQAVVLIEHVAPRVVDLTRWTSLGGVPSPRPALRARVAYERDGGGFVSAQGAIDRWDFTTATPRKVVRPQGITTLAVSRDGSRLAAGWGDTLSLIDVARREVVADLRWQPELVRSAAFAPDGTLAVADFGAPAVRRFAGTRSLPPFDSLVVMRRIAVLADGTGLGLDYERRLVRLGVDRAQEPLPQAAIDLAVSPDGRRVAVIDAAHAILVAADLHAGSAFTPLTHERAAVDVAVADDGAVALVTRDGVRRFGADGVELAPWPTPGADLVTVALAADLVAAGSKSGAVRVWHGEGTMALVREHGVRADTLVIDPRGRWIASGGWDGEIHFLRRPDAVGPAVEAEPAWGFDLAELLARPRE